MNVFEDLIVELKKENLLESTVIETGQNGNGNGFHLDETEVPNKSYGLPEYSESTETLTGIEPAFSTTKNVKPKEETHESIIADDYGIHETMTTSAVPEPTQSPKSRKGKEFFKKRAMDEVSSLQMVEHVVTGVEREYMKVVPKTFDDFNAKKALHSFVHLDHEVNSEEHAAAEFTLMQETEAWCSALATRDRDVPVSNLRQYCENSRPALSSQALLGLARFYRNLPYSESVRSKFDFVITRLFSRPGENEQRVCLFNRDEMLGHINMLYSEWSSISLYAADDDVSNVLLTALSFEDLSIEAENASTFDQLIENDFFGRLRMFKESISELFFAPNVTAAAIECNIRIGNAYVTLIDRERQKMDSASLQSKYGNINDRPVSEATGRTLELVDLLRSLAAVQSAPTPPDETEVSSEEQLITAPIHVPPHEAPITANVQIKEKIALPPFVERLKENALAVNKWFLAACLVLIAASFGVYFWSNNLAADNISSAGVQNVDIDNPVLAEYIKTARISGETFYGLLLPSWDVLPKEKREEFLKKVYQAGAEKGYRQVNLISKDGKMVGFASATRLEVVMP